MSEHFPGVQAKIQEYALRILNGEDPDFVLDGAETFRPAVEAAVAEYQEKKNAEREKQNSEGENPIVEDVPNPILSKDAIEKREHDNKQKIEALQEELKKDLATEKLDPFAHMDVYEGAGEDHKQGVQIYNTLMNIGKGISEGMKEAFDPKVQQYVNEIRSGKSKEYVLGGAPKSMVDAVEKELAKDNKEDGIEKKEGYIENLEELHSTLADLSKDYYFLTHQTYSDFAEKINREDFLFQGGGLNTTTLTQGPDGIALSLKRMENGESEHRGSDSMVIFSIPKKEFEKYREGGRFHPDAFADMLVDTKLEEINKSGSLRIPHEYVLGVYEKGKGFLLSK